MTGIATSRATQKAARLGDQASIYERLKQMILDNELTAGGFVLQEELGERLGVSRTPIREALIRLEQEGLVEIRPRHGMRVLPISVEAMREIYEVLTALEALAARLDAERGLSKRELADLDRAVSDMEKALARDDLNLWAEADARFHRLLVEYSANGRLIGMVATVLDQAYRARRITLRLRAKPTRSNEDHRAVVKAIRDRDPETAYRIHERHRRESGKMLVALLERLDIKTV